MGNVLKNRGFSRIETAQILGVKHTQLEWWTKNLDPLPTRTKYSVDVGFAYFILHLLVNYHSVSVHNIKKIRTEFSKIFHFCASENELSLIKKTILYSHFDKDIFLVNTNDLINYNSGMGVRIDLSEQLRNYLILLKKYHGKNSALIFLDK